jgi:hypothetical protein
MIEYSKSLFLHVNNVYLLFYQKTQHNLIKIRSTHLLPIFYRFFFVAACLHERPIVNREQVCAETIKSERHTP